MRSPKQSVIRFAIAVAALIGVAASVVTGVLLYENVQKEKEWARKRAIANKFNLGPDNPPSPENFAPGRAAPEQSAITEIRIVAGQQAGSLVDDDELVLGVVVNGQARAYSINTLTGPSREIFNDVLGGVPVAATW